LNSSWREDGVRGSRSDVSLRASGSGAEAATQATLASGGPGRTGSGPGFARGTGGFGAGLEIGRPGARPRDWDVAASDQPRLNLLVVDEDASVRRGCVEVGRRMGFAVVQAVDTASAQAIVRLQKVDLMLLDLRIPGTESRIRGGGLSLLEEVKALHPEIAVVVMTASATVTNAVETMRLGAEDYPTKPFAVEDLTRILERATQRTHFNAEARRLRERLRSQRGGGSLIGQSPEMEKLYRILAKVTHSSHPVLLMGESGAGKETVARWIHFNCSQASKPFVPVDCGSISPDVIEGELFGYVRGAAPEGLGAGAAPAKLGLLASADEGTVFLDEIGTLPLGLQAKLLRALQEKAVRPVGGTHSVPISARVLAATNADLAAMVEQGKFRRDLYFRLNVVSLRIPALRQRREDIPVLAQHFLDRIERETGVRRSLADESLRLMMLYDWPGNVRELESVMERACTLSSGPLINVGDLTSPLQQLSEQRRNQAGPVDLGRSHPGQIGPIRAGASPIQSIAEMERAAILATIWQLKGDKLLAAKLLGIGKTTLYRKLKEYGIQEWESMG
jgi:DNA-binding NtrC family response regulator